MLAYEKSQSLPCLKTQRIEVTEYSDQNQEFSSTGWLWIKAPPPQKKTNKKTTTVFRVTQPYLNLLVKPRKNSGYLGKI